MDKQNSHKLSKKESVFMDIAYNVDGYEVKVIRLFDKTGDTICEKVIDVLYKIYLQERNQEKE